MSANKAIENVKKTRNEFADSVVNMIDFLSVAELTKLIEGLPEDIAKMVLIKLIRKHLEVE